TAHLTGQVGGFDQLGITVDKPTSSTIRTPSSPGALKLPAVVAIVLPPGTGGDVDVRIDAYSLGQAVAFSEAVVQLPASGGHVSRTFVLGRGPAAPDEDMAMPADSDGAVGMQCDGACPVAAVCGNG